MDAAAHSTDTAANDAMDVANQAETVASANGQPPSASASDNSESAAHTPSEPAAPVSDLAVAAQYADAELQSVVNQFATAAVVSQAPVAPTATENAMEEDSSSDSEDDKEEEENKPTETAKDASSDSESDDEDEADRAKLRADIEAAMDKEDSKNDGPVKTANEVSAPVREPTVELTADCPIAQCGTILNVSVPGLMMTIKSSPGAKPLEDGSVLCLEDRTVLGCVDEIFGPVLMPMYLVRYENAAKMPQKATINAAVYYPTEHATYIVPEDIKDKGTDASNIFDEEADDTEFSDDEAEAAAKRNRKRNRGGAHATPAGGENSNYTASSGRGGRGGRGGRAGRGGNFSDYHSHQNGSFNGGRGSYTQQQTAMQTQPYGGVTKYTQPQAGSAYGAPRAAPLMYGNTNYTSPQNYGGPRPPMPPYGMPQPRPGQQMPYYQPPPPPPQYNAHNLPPYPPHAPPPHQPQAQYQQYSQPTYAQPPPQRYTQAQPPPPQAGGYYGANSQQQHPPRGSYDQRRYQ
ncbi:H/ACA ribonucleoprotein complex non-core subunit naf1 [Phytophthora boehmeriae]|uniref:H/ACA ribonucleoprotein complex non-core subunit naf1 n=1 Tax=Phytophthora boehmeriae TaxID=109152 RepID=A0A8T1WVR1_9STRA|nr:H/ACA ribonucleoprotein complex non-core subunit naf1 [Phytophthora boehmeriae]